MKCITPQHTATHCNTLQHTTPRRAEGYLTRGELLFNRAQDLAATSQNAAADRARIFGTAARCNTLQHPATHCKALQHRCTHDMAPISQHFTADRTRIFSIVLQHTVAHCNTLQHTAAHSSTLQHTTTRCNTLQHIVAHAYAQHGAHFTMFYSRSRANFFFCMEL